MTAVCITPKAIGVANIASMLQLASVGLRAIGVPSRAFTLFDEVNDKRQNEEYWQ